MYTKSSQKKIENFFFPVTQIATFNISQLISETTILDFKIREKTGELLIVTNSSRPFRVPFVKSLVPDPTADPIPDPLLPPAIIGGIGGGIGGLFLVLGFLIGFFLWKKRRENKIKKTEIVFVESNSSGNVHLSNKDEVISLETFSGEKKNFL